MALLTRDRAGPGQVPTPMMAEYYRQRASAGLIVTEASQVCAEGQGYLDTPGIYNAAQVAGWRRVTDAVHAEGGRIVIQLWHVGRISHVRLQPGGVGAGVPDRARVGEQDLHAGRLCRHLPPRALRTDELPGIVDRYRHRALRDRRRLRRREVHGANGYLLDQFLRDSINDRSDAYGGPIEHRARLLLEVMHAIAGAIGPGRTALRLSPVTPSNGAGPDSDPQACTNTSSPTCRRWLTCT